MAKRKYSDEFKAFREYVGDQSNFRTKAQLRTTVRRLTKLEKIVSEVPTKQFDMEFWFTTNCKTVGCALGHAASDRSFNRAGLKLVVDENPYMTREVGKTYHIPSCGMGKGEDAGAEFFGLTHDEANYLFVPWNLSHALTISDESKTAVRRRIREVRDFYQERLENHDGT